MKAIGKILILALAPLLVSAQKISQPPGVIIDLEKTPKYTEKKQIPLGPLILDTRKQFDYSMAHYENSQPIRWEDFSQTEEPHRGSLDPSNHVLIRKLQALGLGKDREVIVLGQGTNGNGEEGRIAWMLKYLGVKKIKVMNFQSFKGKKVFGEAPEAASFPVWAIDPIESLKIRKNDLEKLIQNKTNKTLIDVRSPDEFNGKKSAGEKRQGHIPGAINIPWKSFVNADGAPLDSPSVSALLKKYGVRPESELIFYSSLGVESGYTTYAAVQAQLKASHYDGSFWEWAADDSMPIEN